VIAGDSLQLRSNYYVYCSGSYSLSCKTILTPRTTPLPQFREVGTFLSSAVGPTNAAELAVYPDISPHYITPTNHGHRRSEGLYSQRPQRSSLEAACFLPTQLQRHSRSHEPCPDWIALESIEESYAVTLVQPAETVT
jgi:hypothetical protein